MNTIKTYLERVSSMNPRDGEIINAQIAEIGELRATLAERDEQLNMLRSTLAIANSALGSGNRARALAERGTVGEPEDFGYMPQFLADGHWLDTHIEYAKHMFAKGVPVRVIATDLDGNELFPAPAGDVFEKALMQTWEMVDGYSRAQPGSYEKGRQQGLIDALKTIKENFAIASAAAAPVGAVGLPVQASVGDDKQFVELAHNWRRFETSDDLQKLVAYIDAQRAHAAPQVAQVVAGVRMHQIQACIIRDALELCRLNTDGQFVVLPMTRPIKLPVDWQRAIIATKETTS